RWIQRRDVQRFSTTRSEDRRLRSDPRTGGVVSRDAHAGRHRRRRSFGHQLRGALLVVHHFGRRFPRAADPGVLPMSESAAIQAKDLQKAFGEQVVLHGVSFSVAKGETLAVLGRSGIGKSVLLRLLIGPAVPDSGSIRILDTEVSALRNEALSEIRKKVGYLFQEGALYDSL